MVCQGACRHNVRVTCGPDWRGPGPAFQRVTRLNRVYASGELHAAIMRARSRGGSDHAQAHCVARAVPVRIRQVHAGVMQPVSSSPAGATDAVGRYPCLERIPVVTIPTQTGGRPGPNALFASQGRRDEWDDGLPSWGIKASARIEPSTSLRRPGFCNHCGGSRFSEFNRRRLIDRTAQEYSERFVRSV